jgi:hypothetical protein
MFAQDVLAPMSQNLMLQQLTNRPAQMRPGTMQDDLTGLPVEELPELFNWGPVRLRPHADYRLIYGDGIQARPGQQFKTFISEFSPGALFELGNHWTLDWTPTLRFYSSSAFRDTFDNNVVFHGATTYEDWSLGLAQTYSSASQPLIETGGQTDTQYFLTALNAVYHMSSKMSLELGANQTFRIVGQNSSPGQLTDWREWSTLDWLNYQFYPDFGAAIGAGFGYDMLNVGNDMTWEQLQGRINWRPATKLSALLTGGFEYRQFLGSSTGNKITPLFSAAIEYQLTETTTLSLNASQVVGASYFAGQLTENTLVGGGLRQRLLQKLWLSLQGGWRETVFTATQAGVSASRDDTGTYFTARLSAEFIKRGTASIFYYMSDNNSNQSGFTYSSSQVGFELAYRF